MISLGERGRGGRRSPELLARVSRYRSVKVKGNHGDTERGGVGERARAKGAKIVVIASDKQERGNLTAISHTDPPTWIQPVMM